MFRKGFAAPSHRLARSSAASTVVAAAAQPPAALSSHQQRRHYSAGLSLTSSASAAVPSASAIAASALAFSRDQQQHLLFSPSSATQRRRQSSSDGGWGSTPTDGGAAAHDFSKLEDELLRDGASGGMGSAEQQPHGRPEQTIQDRLAGGPGADIDVKLVRQERAPARFELVTHSTTYTWNTTAKHGRKIIGPMREWAEEFQCRTGVAVDMEAKHPEKVQNLEYAKADDVEVVLYFFGTSKAVEDCVPFLKAMLSQEPSHVRTGIYRRAANGTDIEWLTLRRINREGRPADIPAISLKTPGKYTLLFENVEEAATRTIFEETGIDIDRPALTKTQTFHDPPVLYYWRPPVHYFIAEMPADAEVLGPQATRRQYILDWDPRQMKSSPDPIDRVWGQFAEPETGCAWLPSQLIDELQMPIKNTEEYMKSRYLPAPGSDLRSIVKLEA